MFIPEDHVAIRAVDHLTELIKTTCHDSKITSKMRFNRSKATLLIQVIASDIQSLLMNKVRNNFFSIAFDETTNVSTTKGIHSFSTSASSTSSSPLIFLLLKFHTTQHINKKSFKVNNVIILRWIDLFLIKQGLTHLILVHISLLVLSVFLRLFLCHHKHYLMLAVMLCSLVHTSHEFVLSSDQSQH